MGVNRSAEVEEEAGSRVGGMLRRAGPPGARPAREELSRLGPGGQGVRMSHLLQVRQEWVRWRFTCGKGPCRDGGRNVSEGRTGSSGPARTSLRYYRRFESVSVQNDN